MQLPSIDRQSGLRPAGADLASSNGQKVIPVAPVNPPVTVNPQAGPAQPGVVNMIGEGASLASTNSAVYQQSVPDPIRRGGETSADARDWTIQHPEPEKVEDPPPVPISQLMLEFLQSMWRASGTVVEVAQAQSQNLNLNPNATPGQLAKEELTYTPRDRKSVV